MYNTTLFTPAHFPQKDLFSNPKRWYDVEERILGWKWRNLTSSPISITNNLCYFQPVSSQRLRFNLRWKKGGLPSWCSGWESTCRCGGRGFKPWSGKIPLAAGQLGPCATATEPALRSLWATTTEARGPGAHAPQQERLPHWVAHAPQGGVAPPRATRERPCTAGRT